MLKALGFNWLKVKFFQTFLLSTVNLHPYITGKASYTFSDDGKGSQSSVAVGSVTVDFVKLNGVFDAYLTGTMRLESTTSYAGVSTKITASIGGEARGIG